MMSEKYKVSIIIPVHNSSKTILRCIDSINSQDYKNIECIIIENGSKDNTLAICNKLQSNYTYIKVFVNNDIGVSAARNFGLSKVTGDIVGFCDADDYLPQNAISTVIKEFLNDDELSIKEVIGAFYIVNENNCYEYRGKKTQIMSSKEALSYVICDDNVMGSVWNKYFRRDFITGVVFDTELTYCEDMHFNAKVMTNRLTDKVKFIDIPIYCYIDNYDSTTHKVENLYDENNELKYIVAMNAIFRDCSFDSDIEEKLRMKIACFAIDFYEALDVDEDEKKSKLRDLVKKNYRYLIKNIIYNNLKWNIKRALMGVKILIKR